MPLTTEQKSWVLQQAGYDPNKFELDEASETIKPKVIAQPTAGPDILTPKVEPTNSSLASGLKSFAASALPSIGSGLGAAAGLAMAPSSGGLSLLLPLLGGMGGGIATSAAQNAMMPEGLKQNLATAQQEHPIASFIGGLGAMPLGGFYPNPKNIATAAGAVPKLLTGLERTAAEQAALVNSAAGAGIGAGTSVVEPLLQGHAPSAMDVLTGAALGATFNTPNRIGTRLGFHDPLLQSSIIEQTRGNIVDVPKEVAPVEQISITPEWQRALQVQQSVKPAGPDLLNNTVPGLYKEILKNEKPTGKIKYVPNKDAAESALTMEQLQRENSTVVPRQAAFEASEVAPRELSTYQKDSLVRQKDAIAAEALKVEQERIEIEKAKNEIERQKVADAVSENAAKALELKQEMGPKLEESKRPEPIVTTETDKEIYPDYTANQAIDEITNKGESAEDLEFRRIEGYNDKYQSDTPVTTALGEEVTKLNKTGDQDFLPKFKNFIQEKLGVKTDVEGNLVDENGKPVKGSTTFNKGIPELIKLSADRSSIDTPAHEIFHAFISTLRNSTRAGDRRLVAEYERLIESSPDYQKWKAARGSGNPEEYAASNAGFEFVKRAVNVEKPFEKWWNDFHSYLKTRFTKHATEEDYRRLLNYRMLETEPKLNKSSINPAVQPAAANLNKEEKYSDYSPLPFLTSRYDKVADKFKGTEHETISKYVSEKLHKFRGDIDLHNVGPELIQNTEGYTPEEIQRMYKYLHGKNIKEDSGITLTAREQELADKHIATVRKPRYIQQNMGMLVKEGKNLRKAGIEPDGYMWSEVAPEVAYEWAEKPYSEKAKEYDKLYIQHLEKHGIKDAAEVLREYKQAMGDNFARSAEFPALRKAKGVGLPWELVDQNYHSAANRYGKRAAHDLSYFKHIQNDPKMLSALGLNDQTGARVTHPDAPYIGHDRHVQAALRDVAGLNADMRSPEFVAGTRAVGNTIMGAGTAVRNVANMPAFVGQYVQVPQLHLAFKALGKLAENRAEAFRVGATKPDYKSFDAAGKYEGSPNRFVELANKLSGFLRKYQGRDLSDNFEGEYYYSLGKELALDNIYRATKGNKESKWFVERFADVTDTPATEILKGNFTEVDIQKMAKRFVDAARGTYGSEGLPAWAQEGWIAPFAALSRFSIEKSNTIWKDVIMPMKQGIYGPFIRYTLATAGVALGIEEINKLLSGRKGSDPTIPELAIEGKADDYVYKAIALAQLGSYAGWMSDLAKMTANLAEGKPLKYSQPLSFPLYTLATETVGANVADAINALKEGEDPFTVGISLLQTIATQANQTYRYVDANFINAAETERKEKFRDMRVFQELTDTGNQESPTHVNVVGNTKLREFKRTDDIAKASTLASELLEDAFKKANGNPEMLKKELSRLKQNSYQTMPSPETMPQTFIRFLNFLSQRDGEKAAAERLNDFIQQRQINEVKSSLIP